MKSKIAVLKERYTKAKNKAELEAIDKEMSALAAQDNDAFSAAMVDLAHQTAEAATALAIREQLAPMKPNSLFKQKLDDILVEVSWGQIAKKYFGKSPSWLYNKLRGIDGNGKPASLTDAELAQFKGALCDLADRIRRVADSL